MLHKFILFVFLGIAISANAHQPKASSTMLVEKENNKWVLQISASLTAFQQEIKKHFYKTPYETSEEFQQMVLEHVKKNLDIKFNNNQTITLSDGVVRLGHETKVVFEVFGVPSNFKSVEVKNSAFKDIYNNQSALVLLKEGFNKEHFVLNKKNNHTLKLSVEKNKFVIKTKNQASFLSPLLLYLLIGIISIGLVCKFIISKKNKK